MALPAYPVFSGCLPLRPVSGLKVCASLQKHALWRVLLPGITPSGKLPLPLTWVDAAIPSSHSQEVAFEWTAPRELPPPPAFLSCHPTWASANTSPSTTRQWGRVGLQLGSTTCKSAVSRSSLKCRGFPVSQFSPPGNHKPFEHRDPNRPGGPSLTGMESGSMSVALLLLALNC